MADVKISALPPGANAATPDFYPAVKGGVTVRITHAQLMALIEVALTKLLLTGGGIALNSDGSASFAAAAATISNTGVGGFSDIQTGSISINGGVATIDAVGDLNAGSVTADINDVKVQTIGKGFVLRSPNSTQFRIIVDDAGELGTEPA